MATLAPDRWPQATFAVHPAFQLLEMEWDVAPLWHALQGDDDAESEPPLERAHHLAVWRIELEPHWRTLEEAEAPLLAALVAGEPFAELCLRAADQVGEAAAPSLAAGLLRRWIDEQMLAAVTTDGTSNPL